MKPKWKLWLALLATGLWLCFIYTRSAKPAELSRLESGAVLEWLRKLLPFLTVYTVRKLAHFTEFFVLGAMLYTDWRLVGRGPVLVPLGLALAFAAGDELLQTQIPGRSGELRDVLLDFLGAAAAMLLGQMVSMIKRRSVHEE